MKNRGPQRPKPTATDPSTPIGPDLDRGRSEQIQFSLGVKDDFLVLPGLQSLNYWDDTLKYMSKGYRRWSGTYL